MSSLSYHCTPFACTLFSVSTALVVPLILSLVVSSVRVTPHSHHSIYIVSSPSYHYTLFPVLSSMPLLPSLFLSFFHSWFPQFLLLHTAITALTFRPHPTLALSSLTRFPLHTSLLVTLHKSLFHAYVQHRRERNINQSIEGYTRGHVTSPTLQHRGSSEQISVQAQHTPHGG